MMFKLFFLSAVIFLFVWEEVHSQTNSVFSTQSGTVEFTSDAPLELIQAASESLQGAINTDDRTFAFSIPIRSFVGFNSPLQQEHFNENYLESQDFPKATFLGKIIEEIDFSGEGTHKVRAKGILTIHGVPQERIIKCIVQIEDNRIIAKSSFTILLSDHDISIPKIVYQKISEEIMVMIEATLVK